MSRCSRFARSFRSITVRSLDNEINAKFRKRKNSQMMGLGSFARRLLAIVDGIRFRRTSQKRNLGRTEKLQPVADEIQPLESRTLLSSSGSPLAIFVSQLETNQVVSSTQELIRTRPLSLPSQLTQLPKLRRQMWLVVHPFKIFHCYKQRCAINFKRIQILEC